LPTEPEAPRPRWAAVVINYEGGPLLTACVQSVLADSSAGPVDLVVVDNGSADGSVDALRAALPDVRVVRAPGNVGYARAANLGAAATRAPVVAVLNVDLVVEPGAAKALLDRIDHEARLGAIGPQLRNPDGTVYPSARSLPSIPVAVGHAVLGRWNPENRYSRRYRQLDDDPSTPRLVDVVSGAAIWLRRRALDEIGGWDERYFMYLEDTDLCWRLRLAGWDVAYEPSAVVHHEQGAITARLPYRMLVEHHRSAWRFARKRYTGIRAVLLPFAAVFLAARAVLAVGAEAARRRSGGPGARGARRARSMAGGSEPHHRGRSRIEPAD
jgi:N-acetylglucosaminyl-diphospho-decaprenol L-rhamnosyltransferase